MTIPSIPSQGNTNWYAYMQGLDTSARGALQVTDIDSTPITAGDLGLVAPKGVRAYANSTAQTITAGAYPVYLDLDTLDYNEATSLFTVDLTNNKITVSAGGLFLVSWDVSYVNSTALREAYLTVNGTPALSAGAGAGGKVRGSGPLRLAANDYVQVICYVENADTALNTNAPHRCGLGIYQVGL